MGVGVGVCPTVGPTMVPRMSLPASPRYHAEEKVGNMAGQKQAQVILNYLIGKVIMSHWGF